MLASDPDALMADERRAAGYVVVLPGIDGRSVFNHGLVTGLLEAGVPCAIEFYDWTRGLLHGVSNLRDSARHQREADVIAAKIDAYRAEYPRRPVYVMGHSAGGAMTLFALARLPESLRATGGILINPAVSPDFDVLPALAHTDRGLWNFSSWVDLFFLGAMTSILGSADGRRGFCAGVRGFSGAVHSQLAAMNGALPPLRECPYRASMLRSAHYGGHMSSVLRPFIRDWVAPILMELIPVEPEADRATPARTSVEGAFAMSRT